MKKQIEDQSETATDVATLPEKGADAPFLHVATRESDDKLKLPPAPRKSVSSDLATSPASAAGPVRRDWAAALDLINEACEAVKMSEQRAKDAELYNLNLVQSHSEQTKRLEVRAQTAETRAEAAERRAAEAEEWLLLFHDTIVSGVKGVLDR